MAINNIKDAVNMVAEINNEISKLSEKKAKILSLILSDKQKRCKQVLEDNNHIESDKNIFGYDRQSYLTQRWYILEAVLQSPRKTWRKNEIIEWGKRFGAPGISFSSTIDSRIGVNSNACYSEYDGGIRLSDEYLKWVEGKISAKDLAVYLRKEGRNMNSTINRFERFFNRKS